MDDDIKKEIRDSFFAMAAQCFSDTHPDLDIEKDLYLEYVCGELQILLVTPGDNAVFNEPPRMMKTWLNIFAVAWRLGRHPGHEIIVVTYSDRLVQDLAYKIRNVMRKKWYKRVFPRTRIAPDRSARNHFRTTKGGGVFATSMKGALPGFGADLMVIDDPNDTEDAAHPERLEETNRIFLTRVLTRRNGPHANVLLVQNRVAKNDVTWQAMETGEFRKIVLPLVAPKTIHYQLLDGSEWVRKKGELLRPGAYSEKRLERMQSEPMYSWLQQQGVERPDHQRILPEHFDDTPAFLPLGPRVISVDPALKGGPSNSYNVAQLWQIVGERFHLLEQIRVQCDGDQFQKLLISLVKRSRPSALLIEATANGVVLLTNMRLKFLRLRVEGIDPGRDSKSTRLDRHRPAIRKGIISLPANVYWRADFVAEFDDFPGKHTDQVDGTTQVLDFMKKRPRLTIPPQRAAPTGVTATQGPIAPRVGSSPHMQAPGAVACFGSWLRRRRWNGET